MVFALHIVFYCPPLHAQHPRNFLSAIPLDIVQCYSAPVVLRQLGHGVFQRMERIHVRGIEIGAVFKRCKPLFPPEDVNSSMLCHFGDAGFRRGGVHIPQFLKIAEQVEESLLYHVFGVSLIVGLLTK